MSLWMGFMKRGCKKQYKRRKPSSASMHGHILGKILLHYIPFDAVLQPEDWEEPWFLNGGFTVTPLPFSKNLLPDDLIVSATIRDRDDEVSVRDSRPVSDYSSSDFDQVSVVKKRDSNPIRLLQQRPLTRYLPIRGDELNLRQHIETAGHQVELCRHVLLDGTSCRGLLHKLAGKFHYWNKRWFVFDRTKKSLTYYSDRSERKPRGGTYFQAIEEVYVDHQNSVKSPHPHLTFVVKTKERVFYLMAPSAEAMRIWVDVIFTGAEGYQEYDPVP